MSYANVKSFILILMLSMVHCRPAKQKRQSGMMGMPGMGMGGMPGMGSMGMGGMGGMGQSAISGLAGIGVDMNDFQDNSKSDFPDVSKFGGIGGGNSGFGGLDAASSMADVGGNTMWSDFQDIVKSVGAVKNPGMESIGIKASDFPGPSDFQSMSSMDGINGNAGNSRKMITKQVQGAFSTF